MLDWSEHTSQRAYTSLDMGDQGVNDFVQCLAKNGLNIHKYFEHGWMFGGTIWEIKRVELVILECGV